MLCIKFLLPESGAKIEKISVVLYAVNVHFCNQLTFLV